MLLEGRRLLITGVLTEGSIAFAVARRAQEEGAQIVLTGFGRGMRITTRIANRLPDPPDVLELDVNDPDHIAAVVDGHRAALGRARRRSCTRSPSRPADALGGDVPRHAGRERADRVPRRAPTASRRSSRRSPTLLEKGEHGSIVGLDFDAHRRLAGV